MSDKRPTVSYVDNLDDAERPHYLEMLRLLGAVDGWVARIDPVAEPPQPAPGSALRADDQRTHPHRLSHATWNSLSHAVDHLNCLHTLLRDARQIHMYAPYSLVRAALENASAAVWMLHPRVRADRVLVSASIRGRPSQRMVIWSSTWSGPLRALSTPSSAYPVAPRQRWLLFGRQSRCVDRYLVP